MKFIKTFITVLIAVFLVGTVLESCSNKKYSRVKSGSGMGNKADKNKHVWGK